MLDFQAESQLMRIRDIQLLLVTKDMQEYIRSGTNQTKHAAEIAMLERRLDHTGKQHDHDMANKQNVIEKLFEEQKQYALKNAQLDKDVVQVEETVVVKKQQQEIQGTKPGEHESYRAAKHINRSQIERSWSRACITGNYGTTKAKRSFEISSTRNRKTQTASCENESTHIPKLYICLPRLSFIYYR